MYPSATRLSLPINFIATIKLVQLKLEQALTHSYPNNAATSETRLLRQSKSGTYKERDVSHTKDIATKFIIRMRKGGLWSVVQNLKRKGTVLQYY
jgi:hypothetical protein